MPPPVRFSRLETIRLEPLLGKRRRTGQRLVPIGANKGEFTTEQDAAELLVDAELTAGECLARELVEKGPGSD